MHDEFAARSQLIYHTPHFTLTGACERVPLYVFNLTEAYWCQLAEDLRRGQHGGRVSACPSDRRARAALLV
jgi:hypothetical protein